jgi:microsomal dipeptidase-like Zn-dependent dipeptidase
MKAKIVLGLFLLFTLSSLHSFAQEFTVTTTAANITSSRASIDIPGLTGNPFAIIVATPLGDTETYNPNPIGVWYYANKWNIYNTNHAVMAPGLKYKIQFFIKPGPNQFVHIMTQQNIGSEGSYIDNPALNNNPNAQFKILQVHAPDVRPYNPNRFKAKAEYSSAAGRWYIANINGEPLGRDCAYNIVITSGATVGTNPITDTNTNTTIPTPQTGNTGNNPNNSNTKPIPFSTADTKTLKSAVPTSPSAPLPNPTPTILNGFVDMHTHPMSHLGFGKKLLHGAPDIGMLIPAGTRNCNKFDFRASTINEALGNCGSTHGGWGLINLCGDHIRALVINRMFDKDFAHRLSGDPFAGGNLIGDHQHEGMDTQPFNFAFFPNQTSKAHQQMWWEWIKRAKELGNLRVMVALTVNSDLLANILNGDNPKDDKASADLQLDELKLFVSRHSKGPNAWMEIAYTPADLRRIVGENKLAVILGMEVDNIGNFNKPGAVVNQATVKAEIQRLYDKGVRYVFPIHLVNNKFGGAAVYEDLFNFSNKYSTGSFFTVSQSGVVNFKLGDGSELGVFLSTNKEIRPILDGLKLVPYPPSFNADPTSPDFCMNPIPFNGSLGCFRTFKILSGIINPPSEYQMYNTIPKGHVNDIGLTGLGKFAVLEMMKLGMIIDIDHMSDLSQNDTLDIAERSGNDYPINIGHNGIENFRTSERIASLNTVKRIAALKGVFGIGTADSEAHKYDAQTFISSFNEVWLAMGGNSYGAVAIGTDVNGMERLPRASQNLNSATFYSGFPKSKTGNKEWDYTTDGVAHYGLMADFLKDVRNRDPLVHENLMNSAEHFVRMWEKAEKQKTSVK